MALAGVVVTAFTLRLAVSGVSPVLGRITDELHLTPGEAGVLAMMPSLGFALTGILTTLAMRRVGLEALLVVSCGLAAVGTLARALSPDDLTFVVLTFVTMCGLGTGNVVLPPVIKKYYAANPQLANMLAQRLVDATRADVEARIKAFDTRAAQIIGNASKK